MLNFGLPEVSDSKAQRLKVLENFLLEADAAGRICVLIVDEAQKAASGGFGRNSAPRQLDHREA